MFLFILMQGLTIIAFNDGSFDRKTILQLLSLGPTYVVMKFIESEHISFSYCNMIIRVNYPDGYFLCYLIVTVKVYWIF
jgi:hypothetical protein